MHSRSEATATADDNSGKEQRFQQLFHSEAEAGPTKNCLRSPCIKAQTRAIWIESKPEAIARQFWLRRQPRTSLFGDPPPGPLWDSPLRKSLVQIFSIKI